MSKHIFDSSENPNHQIVAIIVFTICILLLNLYICKKFDNNICITVKYLQLCVE